MKSELLSLKNAIDKFDEIDLGYPKGEHRIFEQGNLDSVFELCKHLGISQDSSLARFYEFCGGIELPDVGNGYYVLSPDEIAVVNTMESEPNTFDGRDIVIFGSDSGGGRFVIAKDSGDIFYLPMAEVSSTREYLGHPVKLEVSGMEGFVLYLGERVKEQ